MLKIKTTSGEIKYNQLQKVVKSVFALQNGNAAVERSLSDNKKYLNERADRPSCRNSDWLATDERVCHA